MLAQALGISSFVLSIVAIFVPFYGIFVSGVSGLLAWGSTGRAAFLGLAAAIINLCNIFILSPSFLAALALESYSRSAEQGTVFAAGAVVVVIQLIAIGLLAFNAVLLRILRRRKGSLEETEASAVRSRTGAIRGKIDPATREELDRKRNREFWSGVFGPRYLRWVRFLRVSDFALFAGILLISGVAGVVVYNTFIKEEPSVPLSRVYENRHVAVQQPAPKVETPKPESRQAGTYHPDSPQQVEQRTRVRSPERIYSYAKPDGSRVYTNTFTGAEDRVGKPNLELETIADKTPIEVQDGKIYITVSIEHKGNKLDTSFLVDPESLFTLVPTRNADFVKADYLNRGAYRIVEGVANSYEVRKVERFRVGPKVRDDFHVVTQIGEDRITRGVLGKDFLSHFDFHIDETTRQIYWP